MSKIDLGSRSVTTLNSLNEINWYNLIYKVGTIISKNRQEILLMTIRNDITSSHLPFMNGVSARLSKPVSSR